MRKLKRPSARCRALFIEVSQYLDGDVSAARRRAIEHHIASCACCATMAERLRHTIAACRAAAGSAVPRAVKLCAAKRIQTLLAQNAARQRPAVEP